MIITLTGGPGVGKTTIAGRLLEISPSYSLITSLTTRPRRETDLPHEYKYIGGEDAEVLKKERTLLWWTEVRGCFYGTLRSSVDHYLNHPGQATGIMILVPDKVEELRLYSSGRGGVVSFWIHAKEEVVRSRLKKDRGLSDEELAKELIRAREESERVNKRKDLYRPIDNSGDLYKALEEIKLLVSISRASL